MSVKSGAVNVGSAATPLGVPGGSSDRVVIIRNSGTTAIFVGDSAVTAADGFDIPVGEEIVIDSSRSGGLPDIESIHLVAASSGSARWLSY